MADKDKDQHIDRAYGNTVEDMKAKNSRNAAQVSDIEGSLPGNRR
ncbi:MAG: hypothetical protein AAF526_03355 [Pseudomonadota bacterium]